MWRVMSEKCPKCGSPMKLVCKNGDILPGGHEIDGQLCEYKSQLAAAVSRAETAERERDIALSRVQYLYKLCKRILWLAERSDIKHSRATLHCTCMAIEMRKANGDTK
jgi:hypothetical protein